MRAINAVVVGITNARFTKKGENQMPEEIMFYGFGDVEEMPIPETQTSDRNLSVKIPNVYKRWQPIEPPSPEEYRTDGLPEGVQPESRVKMIFRGGQHTKGIAGQYFWGDDGGNSIIVGYRVLKLETRQSHTGWISWGLLHDAGVTLDTQNGIPEGLSPTARVQVWLRNSDEPQRDVRRAHNWNWQIDGPEEGYHNDIMWYRIVGS